ncbi:hypothetical protein BV898_08159 [Hypsibius exemplaris]|uniref:Uncharacterized protein n=1 Tax=Hypsibius exemplaris TaxID=2072580 RepID=A0A1W0WR97_HYPEX|nr:hypothetical protein BV898_08159 [Hypsibius exemplaris]
MTWNRQGYYIGVFSVFFLLAFQFHLTLSGRSSGGGGGSRSSGSYSSSSRYGSSSSSGSSGGGTNLSPARYSAPASSSSSGTNWGSSSSSGVGAGRVSAPASGSSSGTRWGSSAPSGSSSGAGRVAGPSSAGNARSAVAGTSAARSSNNRPQTNAPQASQHTPVQPTYNTHYTTVNNFGGGGGYGRSGFGTGSLLLAGAGGAIGGYMLGSMIASSVYRDHYGCCYGCGCSYYGAPPPYYYNTYVPYRTLEACRSMHIGAVEYGIWNMPNMVLTFLASNNISGNSITEKSIFLYNFFNTTAEPYGSLNATTNVFTIPPSYDLRVCNFDIAKPMTTMQTSNNLTTGNNTAGGSNGSSSSAWPPAGAWWAAAYPAWRIQVQSGDRSPCTIASFARIPECEDPSSGKPKVEEPFKTAVRHIVKLYSNVSLEQQMILDLVTAVKHCYPENVIPPKEIRTCLDYSISSDQVISLQNQTSIFHNEEICKRYLSPDIAKCVPKGSTFSCTIGDLVNLNVFARNYYLCEQSVDQSLIDALQNRQLGNLASDTVPAQPSGTITTDRLSTFSATSGTGSLRQQAPWLSATVLFILLAFMV